MENRRPKILGTNYLYMIVAILLIGASSVLSLIKLKSIYYQIIITQYIVILLPAILFMLIKKYKFKEVLRLNKISAKQVILSALIPIFAYPIGLFFNYMTIIIISLFGDLQPSPIPIPENVSMFLVSILLIAVTPGICEEIMFRGVIFSAYERIGAKKAIIITGLLFGLFHFDIQNILGPAFLGILFAYMVYKTNSIYVSMIAHAVNNSIALILMTLAGRLEGVANELQGIQQSQEALPMPEMKAMLIFFVFLTMFAVSASLIVYFLLKALTKASIENKNENSMENNVIEVEKEKIGFLHILPIVVVLILFVYSSYSYLKFIMET